MVGKASGTAYTYIRDICLCTGKIPEKIFGLHSQFLICSIQLKPDLEEPSKSPHQVHRRGKYSAKQQSKSDDSKNVIQSATELNSYLEWVTSAEVPKDAVSFKDKTNEYYIAKHLPQLNKDNFEMMEWKECTNQKIPPMSVETCNGYFVAKNAF
ncbi:hypothetical protein cypCar_00048615, partial [Cyprinus carpio]